MLQELDRYSEISEFSERNREIHDSEASTHSRQMFDELKEQNSGLRR